VLDELNHLNIEFVSFRENLDTGGPLGQAIVIIIGAIAELERNLISERVAPACVGPGWKAGISTVVRSTSTELLSSRSALEARVSARSQRHTASPEPLSVDSSSKQKHPLLHLYRQCSKGVPQGTPQLLESKHSKSALLLFHKMWVLRSFLHSQNFLQAD
jgi:Resolvase, N terminal domain